MTNIQWTIFGGLSAFYSALAFKGELPRKEARIFSKRNSRTPQNILLIHLEFLLILWGLIWFYPHLQQILPDWMTDETFAPSKSGLHSYSILECSIPFLLMGMAYIERRLIYVEKDAGDSELGIGPNLGA